MGLIRIVLWVIGIILVTYNLFWYLMINVFDGIIGDIFAGMMLTIGLIAFIIFLVFALVVRLIFWPWRKLIGK